MGFFESDIVQEEAKKLFTDYQELMKLGSDYGKFDREGKKTVSYTHLTLPTTRHV